jgi:hypothetical protein
MNLLAVPSTQFQRFSRAEKLEYLDVLADVVADLQVELTRAQAEQAALVDSLRGDVPPRRDDVTPDLILLRATGGAARTGWSIG